MKCSISSVVISERDRILEREMKEITRLLSSRQDAAQSDNVGGKRPKPSRIPRPVREKTQRQNIQHVPKPPPGRPTVRNWRAERQRMHSLPHNQCEVTQKPLQMKKGYHDPDVHIFTSSALETHSIKMMQPYKPLPPIGSKPQSKLLVDVGTQTESQTKEEESPKLWLDECEITEYTSCFKPSSPVLLDLHAILCAELQERGSCMYEVEWENDTVTEECKITSRNIRSSQYITCPHCFNDMPPRVAQLHIPKCSALMNR